MELRREAGSPSSLIQDPPNLMDPEDPVVRADPQEDRRRPAGGLRPAGRVRPAREVRPPPHLSGGPAGCLPLVEWLQSQQEDVLPSDVRKVIIGEQRDWSSSLDQQDLDDLGPTHIKEEEEELWTSQEGEFPFTPVKSEDDEEEPQSSQLHQRHTGHMEPEAAGEDYGGPEPHRDSETGESFEPDTDDSEDWKETREPKEEVPARKKPFSCSDCGKRFRFRSDLKKHMVTHTGEKPFGCSACRKSFSRRAHLKTHMLTHTGEKPYKCSVCSKRFNQKTHLTRHMIHHMGEKRRGNSVCDQRLGKIKTEAEDCGGPQPDGFFEPDPGDETGESSDPETDDRKETREPQSGLNSLTNKEVPVRAPEKLFICSDCGKRFGTSTCLKRHMRSHTGEKPFSCPICNRSFSQSGGVQKHMVRHTGEKRFSCSVCDRRFAWRYQVHRHECVGLQTEESEEAEPPASSSDPDIQPEPETNIKTEPSSEPDDSVDVEFWKETRQHQSGFTYQRRKRVSVNDGYNSSKKASSCSDDKAEPEAKSEDHGDPDLSGPKHLKSEEVSVSDTGCNTDMKPFVGQTVAKNESLHSHMTGHMTEEKPFHCSVCNTGCSDSESLVQHMRIHMRQTQFRCTICGAEFAWRRYLEKHLEVHTKEKFYSCRDCDQSFTRQYLLRNHKCVSLQSSKLHQTEEVREAEPPACSSAGHRDPDDGEEDCGGPEPGRNPDPDNNTGASSALKIEVSGNDDWKETREPQSGLNSLNNEEVSVSAAEKPFSCSECGKSFRFKGDLKRHVRSHTGEKPFKCRTCDKRFSRRTCLKTHMMTHTGEKPFNCSTCGKNFTQKYHLKRHMTIHTGETLPGCSMFNSRFAWRSPVRGQSSLIYEEVPVGDNEKPFGCSECAKRFRFKTCLKKHMRIHTGEKPFCCSLCGRAFSLSANLKVHMISHTGEKRFVCGVAGCGKRFGFKGDLKRHTRTHTGEKPFSCSVCQKSFTNSGSLHNHVRIHTGERPFGCSVCGKLFGAKAHLKNHMMKHTGEKRFGCGVCEQRFTWFSQLRSHQCAGPPASNSAETMATTTAYRSDSVAM